MPEQPVPDGASDELTRLWRQAESWREEGVRLNREVHELRRQMETIKRESLAPIVRGLLRVVAEMRPFLTHSIASGTPRVEALLLDVANVEDLAKTTLKRMDL